MLFKVELHDDTSMPEAKPSFVTRDSVAVAASFSHTGMKSDDNVWLVNTLLQTEVLD